MLERESRDFVRTVLGIQRATGCSMTQAKLDTARLLEVEVPDEDVFNGALFGPPARRRRGRPPSPELSKRDAVAAVAVYFEDGGTPREQAIKEAKRWLNVTLSRRVAKDAVAAFKANTSPDQFKAQALWAYATYRPGVTQPLPEHIAPARRKRSAKSDLG